MSIASSSYKPKFFEESSDLQDLRQHVEVLIQGNKILTSQLEELIDVNNQLTSSIEEYSILHQEKFGPIDHGQLQELANQVNQLQRQLEDERSKTYHMVIKNTQQQKGNGKKGGNHSRSSSNQTPYQQADFGIDEIYEVIKQLTNKIHYLQQDFYQEIQNLQNLLLQQQQDSQKMMKEMQQKFTSVEQLTKHLIEEMHSRDQIIHNLNRELDMHRTKKSQIHKQMKISHTIQDLRVTLERKIQEKEQIIKYYEALISQLKRKFKDYPI